MSDRDIQSHIAGICGLEASDGAVTRIAGRLIPELRQWRQRLLDAVYPFI
ncbi:transposase [Neisseria iguanae]|nr:transposase [Neisseria iguanae]